MVHQSPTAAKWAAIVERQERSGQSITEFAAEQGLNPNTLSWWRWNLGRERRHNRGCQDRAALPPARDLPPASSKTEPFIEITVSEAEPRAQVTGSKSPDPTLVLALDHYDAHVVVDRATDLQLLRELLAALC